jgi:uncharacterized membrane protein YphA (DoxX/SURF4 family)
MGISGGSSASKLTTRSPSCKFAWGLVLLLGLFFVAQGASKLFGIPAAHWAVRFAQWGYPPWFRHAVGLGEIISGVALFPRRTRKAAAAFLMALMAGAFITHASHGEIARLIPPVILGGMAALLFRRPTGR